MMFILSKQNDLDLPFPGYEPHQLLRTVHGAVMSWAAMICVVKCLIAAALLSRRAATHPGLKPPEVTQ